MIQCADARDCRVLVNGSDAADHPALYLEAGADAVVLGEPDLTVPEVLDAWATGASDIEHIAGLALTRPPRSVTRTKHRPAVHELDELPAPAWDLVDVDAYRKAWHDAHGRFSINLVASRGCPYGCNWCAKPLFGRGYAQRSPAALAAELAWVKTHIRPDHIWFADDIFGLTPAWLESFAQEVQARDALIPFTIQSRVNLMTERSVAALRSAGCEEVWLGVESGSQRVLDAMDKGSRIEQVRTATAVLSAAGVRPCWFIQLGYLGEEWEDIVLTRTLIRECAPADIGVSVAYPLPGTKFYDAVRAQLGMRRNWVDTDELAVLFHGTYTTEFYRRIRDLLHDEVRAPGADYDSAWSALASTRDQFRNELLQAVGG
jgi:anaerobic magnesium-protoporphyrin IX monomethyl ester cyclase